MRNSDSHHTMIQVRNYEMLTIVEEVDRNGTQTGVDFVRPAACARGGRKFLVAGVFVCSKGMSKRHRYVVHAGRNFFRLRV